VARVDIDGTHCVVAGTGYTGEDGLEIAVPVEGAETVWNSLVSHGCVPAGLGARDTLRLEAALPLHGHELGAGITPLQAGLEWVVSWTKQTFRGRAALLDEKERGPSRILRGVEIEGRRPARDGATVLDTAGNVLGAVTSGNFSPTLGHCIALALVSPEVVTGSEVSLDVRGSTLSGRIVPTPFVGRR
jgi:aminomethyltransferase